MWSDRLTSLIVVIILPCTCKSNHYTVHFKHTQYTVLYVNYISVKLGRGYGKCAVLHLVTGFPRWWSGRESACQCRRHKRQGFNPWVRKIPWSRTWQPLQYSCQDSPMDRGVWWATAQVGHKELDTTEHTHTVPLFGGGTHRMKPEERPLVTGLGEWALGLSFM